MPSLILITLAVLEELKQLDKQANIETDKIALCSTDKTFVAEIYIK